MTKTVSTPATGVLENTLERIIEDGQMLAIELPRTVHDLKEFVIEKENDLARESAKLGFAFLALKSQIPAGEFKTFLNEHSLSEQRTYELISIAKMLLNLPARDQKKLIGTSKSKLIELAKIPTESINEIAESGQLDELSTKSANELRKEVQRLKAKLADEEVKKGTEAAQRKKLQAMLDLRREDSGFPDFYLITREESRAMATQAEMALEQMAALFNEEIQRANHSGNSDDVQHYCERGLATLYSHVYGTACRYAELARRMMESMPLEITDDLGAKLPYTPQEVAIGLERHNVMMAEFKAQANARQDARDDAKPRGKGRPKNKAEA